MAAEGLRRTDNSRVAEDECRGTWIWAMEPRRAMLSGHRLVNERGWTKRNVITRVARPDVVAMLVAPPIRE